MVVSISTIVTAFISGGNNFPTLKKMRHIILLYTLFLNIEIAFCQPNKTDTIINNHLASTCKTSWSDLKTIASKGITHYADSVYTAWEDFKSGTQRRLLIFDINRNPTSLGENEVEIWRIKDEKVVRSPKFHLTSSSRLNLSYALERRSIENSAVIYLRDTTITGLQYHILQFRESDDLDNTLLYINAQNHRLEYEAIPGKESQWIQYSNFTWVDGFLLPMLSTGHTNGKFRFKRIIKSIAVNTALNEDVLFKP